MKHYLLLLLATAGLLTGCGDDEEKKDDPKPAAAAGQLSCTIDGVVFKQTATAQLLAPSASTNNKETIIITASTPAGQPPVDVLVVYRRPAGGAYVLDGMVHRPGGSSFDYAKQLSGSLTGTTGNYSGTFSGVRLNASGAVVSKIENGVFTSVK